MNAKENAKQINDILKRINVTQSDIADNLVPPVRQSAVNQVIHRKQTSKRIRIAVYEHVGKYIGRSFEEVWPQQTE